jgi:hypothetical protein
MVGLGKNNLLLKSPKQASSARDFSVAGMTSTTSSKLLDAELQDDLRLQKSFGNSTSPHASSSSDKEEGEGLFRGLTHSSDEQHDMADEHHALMNFASFDDYIQI